jgi:HEAT repeat protein
VTPSHGAALDERIAGLAAIADPGVREQLLRTAFRNPDPAVREAAIALAARRLEPEVLVPLVADSADATCRNAALVALERQGPYAAECLARLVADPDPDTAMFACQALGHIGGYGYEDALLPVLERPEPNVVHAAAEALGRLGSERAIPALVALLEREPWLQLPAIAALGMIAHESAAPALMTLVPDSFVAAPALEALGRIGAPHALDQLVELLLDRAHAALRPGLLAAIGVSLPRAAAWPDFAPLRNALHDLEDPTGLRHFLVQQLEPGEPEIRAPGEDRRGPRGGATLTQAAGALVVSAGLTDLLGLVVPWAADVEGRAWVLAAVARHPDLIADRLPALLVDADPRVRAGTLRVAPPEAVGRDRLLDALGDSATIVRTAAISALTLLEDPSVAEPLVSRLASGDSEERSAAAGALSRFEPEVLARLLPPLLDGDDEMLRIGAMEVLVRHPVEAVMDAVFRHAASGDGALRRASLRAVARYPGSRSEVLLLRALADRDISVQADALELLVARGGTRLATTLLALLSAGDSLRYHVIRALGRLRIVPAAAPLEGLFATTQLHERIEIVVALGRIASDTSREFLRACLDHPELEIRRVAAHGLVQIGNPADDDIFLALADNSDWVLRNEAAEVLGRLRRPEARKRLLNLARDLEPAVARTARASLALRA